MSVADGRPAAFDGIQGMAFRLGSAIADVAGASWHRWSAFAFVEQMFLILRLLALPGVFLWLWFNPQRYRLLDGVITLIVFFAIYSAVVHIAAFTLPHDRLKRFEFLEVLCDLIFVTLLLSKTGTAGGIFQFGYILLIAFSSYYFQLRSAVLLVIVTLALSLILSATRVDAYWGDFGLLAGFEVLVAIGVGVLSRRDRREKERVDGLNRELKVRSGELMQAYRGILSSWASAVDAKDAYTRGHAERVSGLARSTAEAMGLPQDECDKVAIAALLHDVGKIAVPDAILGKPSRLTSKEWLIVRQHPSVGADMISRVESLRDIVPIIRSHHERADGSGYPHGARLHDIPLGARIIAVADVYDAMTSERIYRRAMRQDEAVKELIDGARNSFDPEVVKAFLNIVGGMPRMGYERILSMASSKGSGSSLFVN